MGFLRGKRNELVGGGLLRSLKMAGFEEVQAYDERVLGSGEFVEQLRREKELSDRLPVVMPLKELIERIAEAFGMKPGDLKMRHRSQKFADARSVISYFAVREMGHNGAEVARMLNISRSGVSIAAGRGEEFVRKNQSIKSC